MSTSFKTSMFGGFDRSDVIAYIEKTGREHEERVAALEAENETLRKENQTLENTQRVTQAQLLKMRDNEETCRRLLADVDARNQELEQRCAQLKVQADEYESLKDHVAQIEISAHRRTEQFREEAVTRLRQLAARQREWCRTAQADYEQMNCQLPKIRLFLCIATALPNHCPESFFRTIIPKTLIDWILRFIQPTTKHAQQNFIGLCFFHTAERRHHGHVQLCRSGRYLILCHDFGTTSLCTKKLPVVLHQLAHRGIVQDIQFLHPVGNSIRPVAFAV